MPEYEHPVPLEVSWGAPAPFPEHRTPAHASPPAQELPVVVGTVWGQPGAAPSEGLVSDAVFSLLISNTPPGCWSSLEMTAVNTCVWTSQTSRLQHLPSFTV